MPKARLFTCFVGFALSALAVSGSASEPITIRFAVWDGDEALRAIRNEAKKFDAAHPGIHLKIEPVPYGPYTQKLLAQYAADVAPDVAMMEGPYFQKFARRGAILPLETFFSQIPGFDIDAYYKPIREAFTYQGKLYVLPRDIAPIGLIYFNKRIFDEAGIPYPDGTWTWDFDPRPELREKCFTWVMQQLTKKDANGKVVRWGFAPGAAMTWTETAVYSQGLRFANDREHPTELFYTDPRVVRTFQWVADLAHKRKWIPSTEELVSVMQTGANQLFQRQQAAMFQNGIWDVPNMRKVLRPGSKEFFEWDIALAPGYIDPTSGKVIRAMPTGGSGYAVMSSTKHPKEAWLAAQWMAGEPGMLALARAGIAQPAMPKLARSEPWVPGPDTPPEERYPASRIITDEAVQYVVFEPTADYWRDVRSRVDAKHELIFNGRTTAANALAEGQADAERRLTQLLAIQDLPNVKWGYGLAAGALLLAALLAWVYLPEKGVRYTLRERKENRAAYAFISPWIVGMLGLTLGPMILSLIMSFADWDIITAAKWRGFGNFLEAFVQDPRFWKSLRATTIYTVFAVPLGLIFSLALALLLNTKVRGIALYRTFFYLPALASGVAASLIWSKIFQARGGLLNSLIYGADGEGNFLGLATLLRWITQSSEPANWLGDERLVMSAFVMMSLWGVGGGMIILLAGLQGIPNHYYEAATLDGAGAWTRFKAVTLPLLSPSLFFSLVTGMIGSFQIFTQAYVITGGGPDDSTRFFVFHLYDEAFNGLRMGYASALAWVLFAIILILTFLQFKLNRYVYYESGATR